MPAAGRASEHSTSERIGSVRQPAGAPRGRQREAKRHLARTFLQQAAPDAAQLGVRCESFVSHVSFRSTFVIIPRRRRSRITTRMSRACLRRRLAAPSPRKPSPSCRYETSSDGSSWQRKARGLSPGTMAEAKAAGGKVCVLSPTQYARTITNRLCPACRSNSRSRSPRIRACRLKR